MSTTDSRYQPNAEPFFRIVMEGLKDEVDSDFFWDAVADDAVFEFLYTFPANLEKPRGREDYEKWFEGYAMNLHTADNLVVHKAANGVVVLEYEVHGTYPGNGKAYDNRFCSIVTIKDKKISRWRDYTDSLAVMHVLQ